MDSEASTEKPEADLEQALTSLKTALSECSLPSRLKIEEQRRIRCKEGAGMIDDSLQLS